MLLDLGLWVLGSKGIIGASRGPSHTQDDVGNYLGPCKDKDMASGLDSSPNELFVEISAGKVPIPSSENLTCPSLSGFDRGGT